MIRMNWTTQRKRFTSFGFWILRLLRLRCFLSSNILTSVPRDLIWKPFVVCRRWEWSHVNGHSNKCCKTSVADLAKRWNHWGSSSALDFSCIGADRDFPIIQCHEKVITNVVWLRCWSEPAAPLTSLPIILTWIYHYVFAVWWCMIRELAQV